MFLFLLLFLVVLTNVSLLVPVYGMNSARTYKTSRSENTIMNLTLFATFEAKHMIIDFDVNDVNGDGIFDIAITDSPSASSGIVYLRVLQNNGNDLWNKTFSSMSLGNVRLVDLNKDSKADVIVGGRLGSSTVYTYNSNGSLLWARSLSNWVDGIGYGNFDGDEELDVVAGTWGDVRAWNYFGGQLWRYTGTTFSSAPTDVVDLTNDNLDDVIVGTAWKDGRLHSLGSNGTLLWTFGPTGSNIYGYAANLDCDNESDVLALSSDGYIRGIRSNGSLIWEKFANWSTILFKGLYTRPGSFSSDYNKDGRDDVILSNKTQIRVLSGVDGAIINTIDTPFNVTAGAVADMDKDGILDFIVAGDDGIIYVLKENGEIICTFEIGEQITPLPSHPIGIADMNADGIPDIVAVANHTRLYVITSIDISPPKIGEPMRIPSDKVLPDQHVEIFVNVTDALSQVQIVLLYYRHNSTGVWSDWNQLIMQPTTGDTYKTTISNFTLGTCVEYYINATDSVGNWAIAPAQAIYSYCVVPEYPQMTIPLLIMLLSALAIIFMKRKSIKS